MRHLFHTGKLCRNLSKMRIVSYNYHRPKTTVYQIPEYTTCKSIHTNGCNYIKRDLYMYARIPILSQQRIPSKSNILSKLYNEYVQYSTRSEEELSLCNEKVQHCLSEMRKRFRSCFQSPTEEDQLTARSLKPLMVLLEEVDKIQSDIDDLRSMASDPENDKEMKQLAESDLEDALEKLKEIEDDVLNSLVPPEPLEDTDTIVEVSAGIGGQEAMLFCQEVFTMYTSYAEYMGWEADVTDYETTDIGGVRHAVAIIRGEGAYRLLKYEGGIHRVQRVPKTEKAGRIHTSTVSVAVMPQPSEIDVQISEKDLKIETKRASGAGGQHVNTTDSAVRIVHIPTGIAVESQKERSQHRNKDECMKKLRVQLYQVQLDENMAHYTSNRKLQVGTRARSEKIRTYNYPQDRVTDHRIGVSVHNLQSVLNGSDDLHALICQLLEEGWKERLWDIINNPQISQ